MVIRVKAHGLLRAVLGDREVAVSPAGNTLGDLIEQLATQFGAKVKEELFDEEGNLDYSHAFFVRGERRSNLSDKIEDGDEVVVTSIIGGGRLC
ncbi:MAG: MoaD/ThiS family protein [Dehalococcoidia bacterium]